MHLAYTTQLLGGKEILGQEVRTQMDLVSLSCKGVSKASLLNLADHMGTSVKKLAALIPVTERTIQRYSLDGRFNRRVSESILHIAEVVARGEEVFEDKESFLSWLAQPSTALGGQSPESLLFSRFGAEMVMDELTRIEHGVVS